MKKIFLGIFTSLLFLSNTVFASGGHGEGEAYFIILMILFLHIILLIALIISTSNLPKSINYYKSFFVFSVFLYLVWGTWYLYFGFFGPIGDIIFGSDYNKYVFMKILGVFSLLLPILCVLLIIFFRKKIHNLMEKYSKIVYIFLYFMLPIIMLILSMVLLGV